MATNDDIRKVNGNIAEIYDRRRVVLYALSLAYAGYAIRAFRARQPAAQGARGKYWTNRTGQAAARMFSDGFRETNAVGWFMAHGVPYGVYLELANDRRNEALKPTVEPLAVRMFAEVARLFGDS